jgi:hypothetical protein
LLLALVVTGSLAFACANDEAARYYGSAKYPAKNSEDVELLFKAPARDYVVIADIQAYNVSPDHMRKRAAEIGADAVIVVLGGGAYSASEVWAGQDRYSTTYNRLLASAIKYK